MKINKILTTVFALTAVLAMTGCGEDIHRLKLSATAQTLPCEAIEAGGENAVTIQVSTYEGAAWTVALENEDETWVSIGEKTSNSVKISVENNDGARREARLIFKSGSAETIFTIYQLSYEGNIARYRDMQALLPTTVAISPSGKYVGGFIYNIDPDTEEDMYIPVIIEVATDKWNYMTPIYKKSHSIKDTYCITDQGVIFFEDGANGGSVGVDLNDNVFKPAKVLDHKFLPAIQSSSADGTIMVGYSTKTSLDGNLGDPYIYGYWPIVWENNEPRELKRPALSFKGDIAWAGVMARGVSANGKVIYGTAWETEENVCGGMVSWDENGDPYYIGGVYKGTNEPVHVWETVTMTDPNIGEYKINIATGFITSAEIYNISASGRWIAGTLITEKKTGANTVTTTSCAAFYNTETKETTVFKDQAGSGLSVTDDGIGVIGFGGAGAPISSGIVVDVNSGAKLGSTKEWINAKYGIDVTSGFIRYMCADGETIFGIQQIAGGPAGSSTGYWYVTPPKK